MKENKHLTPEGRDEIRKIKAGMNRGRGDYGLINFNMSVVY